MTAQLSKENIMQFPKKSPYECSTGETFTPCKLPKGMPDWWKDHRDAAFDRFKKQGLPTQKLERFKYSNVAKAAAQWDGVLGDHGGNVEGDTQYLSSLSDVMDEQWMRDIISQDPPGAEKYADMALWDLNSAYLKDGSVIDIPANTVVDKPLLLNLETPDDSYTSLRLIVRVGDGAEFTLVENHNGNGEYWKNHVSQIILGNNAKLNHIRIVSDSDQSTYTQTTHVQIGRDSNYECFTLTEGAGFSRHQAHAQLTGVNGNASFNGLNLLNGKQHADTTILIDHEAAHCTSNQFYRSLLDDKAHGVFQGKVHVFENAQKTDGYQLSNTILLSEHAQMDTKPELEIYADDVQCSHGATTGQLDEEPLFYLRSRGLNEKEARFLLMQAFIAEIVEKVGDEGYREIIQDKVETWLQNTL